MSDGFLARWAQRKRAVRRAERPETSPPEAETALDGAVPPADGAAPPDTTDEAVDQDVLADLPSLADLTAETDLTPFLRAGIPAALRNAALRKMWSVDPAIRDFVSEAREYAYDWNTPGSVPGLGPLLPSDDVKAMLGRMFNAPPSEEPEDDSGAAETTPPDPVSESDTARISSVADVPLVPDGSPVESTPEAVPAIFADETPATIKTVVTKQRLRRHGGAMPS
ncbi:DUF3306 domain-containing protein [Methylobacterium gossipiicola]|uniref:DUF3306 domain-containing protein n=1 Tax=Methylobacterium gossipiicola TaxID=582675 RepID=A0A1I2V6B8_9HYPH|nr:DUF3306 domain-containing protein [Methylobacterium gossipiicola]SFG84894.1 Protein of unknown function [Methylobacterium gossipiicola]